MTELLDLRRVVVLSAMVSALSATGAAADWRSIRSDHFEAVGNASSRELRDVTLRFEQFRDIVRRLDPAVVPDDAGALVRIVVFRNPTLAICDTEADVVEEVGITVVHEIAHHFGIDDARLGDLGYA